MQRSSEKRVCQIMCVKEKITMNERFFFIAHTDLQMKQFTLDRVCHD